MSQLLALGVLGLGGFAVYRRSQQLQNNALLEPLEAPQELSARKYVLEILFTNDAIAAVGADLGTALKSMDWGDMPDKQPDVDGKYVSFANPNITPVPYSEVFNMNGLQIMQLSNRVRVDPNTTKLVFDLNRRTVITPIAESAIKNVMDALKNISI